MTPRTRPRPERRVAWSRGRSGPADAPLAVENRDLVVGMKLVGRYKKQEHTCEVVETENGLRFRLDDGSEFKSLSSAAMALMDGKAVNGWRFWTLAGQMAAETPAPTEPATATETARAAGAAVAGMAGDP